jgi:predicted nucleic acid-binding protein
VPAGASDALSALVRRSNLRLASLTKPRTLAGLGLCRDSKRFSFTDALLWAQALDQKAERLYSFDRKFPSQGLVLVDLA